MDNGKFDLDKYNEEQHEYLGMTVFWEVMSCNIPVDVTFQALSDCGFGSGFIKNPTPRKAFGKAARVIEGSNKHKIARKISDTPQKAVIGIVGESKDIENESLSYRQEATVRLNKETGSLDWFGDSSLGDEFKKIYERALVTIDEIEFRSFAKRVFEDNNGIMIRDQGGVYFILRKDEERIFAVDKMFRELGIGKIGIIRAVNGALERRGTWDSFVDNFNERVGETLKKIRGIGKRAACLAKHEDRLDEIKKMADVYIVLCEEEEEVENIRKILEDAGNEITAKMVELSEVK